MRKGAAMTPGISRRMFVAGAAACAGVGAFPPAEAALPPTPATRRGLIIMVEFPDNPLRVEQGWVEERFAILDRYVREMSYGQDSLDVHASGWRMMPQPLSRYAISPINLQVDKTRVIMLIQHAIDAIDDDYDLSRYDHVVVYLRARFLDYGMVGLCGYPGMLGWRTELPLQTRLGQSVRGGVAIFTASAHPGTLFHDCAHVWGGVRDGKRRVPCLYDHDLQVQYPTLDKGWANALINMGFWDPMSCHSYKRELPPPGISSWTRLRLGWMPAAKIRDVSLDGPPEEIVLAPLADGSGETLAIRVQLSRSRYVLIENRQPVGHFDTILPGHGVLVMKADDDVAECRHGRAPVRLIDADPSQKHLLGAAFDIGRQAACRDGETGLSVTLLEKIGLSYRVRVGREA
ncbi:hypothetical protein [Magnetospirillum sp. SS-4]|uniref:hypothetical protein n=1 Tax=Magnetospirillum sp. SS-4 TaxID=2681465 RepID=UPI0013864D30|nr:hypothetical protein [Magnetospirillum sp. SS-4]CAA7620048.1 exported hypothetical protein [Magnetospirillum sp. SS-4]